MSILSYYQHQGSHINDDNLFNKYDPDREKVDRALSFLKFARHSSKHITINDCLENYEHLTELGHEVYPEGRHIDRIWFKLFPEPLSRLCRALISHGFQCWKIETK